MKNSEKADKPMSAMLYFTSPRRLSGKASQADRTPSKRASSISMPACTTPQAKAKPTLLISHLELLEAYLFGCGGWWRLGMDAIGGLEAWLAPFLAALGRKTRRSWAPLYVQGLLGPDEGKSVQPMAQRLGLPGHDQLHHFLSSPAWDDAPLWRVLADEAGRLVGGERAVLVVDDTGLPKKGSASVGVAPQYCGQLGKQANCQVLVSLTLAQGEVPVPVGLRLFLPKTWTEDPDRCARAGVPEAARTAQGKPEMALAEIDRVRAAGITFGCVLADAGYGMSAAFRQGLNERQLAWAVGIPRTQKVYTTAVRLEWPQTRTGRPRKVPKPSEEPRPVDAVLATARWRRVAWRQGTKGALAARFAAVRIRVGAPPTRRRGVAGWRVARQRRAQVLPQQLGPAYVATRPGCCHQGAVGVRAGAPATQAGGGPRRF
jgi:SRSO17 transposase